ncbi:hypothetical protein AGMMS50243_15890 [Betaproteobacteria bacterium]|nr:hypothetical protein AGMMS50243_15890 [Betaproteobacteria bacterium]
MSNGTKNRQADLLPKRHCLARQRQEPLATLADLVRSNTVGMECGVEEQQISMLRGVRQRVREQLQQFLFSDRELSL